MVYVKKKDGSIRPCIDYRKLNAVTRKDAFPIPRISDCLDAVAGATSFSTLDLTSGYHQVPVRETDKPKTAFTTKHGLWEYNTMPMGLSTASQTFQRVMELALNGMQWVLCILYIDDIIVYGSNTSEHIERLEMVFDCMRLANLKLKPGKCDLLKEEVRFLGHVVSKAGVKPDPHNIAKVVEWPVPQNVTEVRQFLGICSYYRRKIKQFAEIARPLFDLTKKDKELVWDKDCQAAFERLKEILTGTEIMAYPMKEGKFILDTDASQNSIGAVLSQVQENEVKVISYASRTLNKAESNYCVTDKELLAVRYFVSYFRQYLLGRRFTVRSDHQALKWLFSYKEPKGRVARWIEILSEYDFEIEFRQGLKHNNADSMSRCPNVKECECAESDDESLKCGPCDKCKKGPTICRVIS